MTGSLPLRDDLPDVKTTNFMDVARLHELVLDAAAEFGKVQPAEIAAIHQGISLQMTYSMMLEILNRVRKARDKKE